MSLIRFAAASILAMLVSAAEAQTAPHLIGPDRFHITDAERAACQGDAASLCITAYPDEDRLLACMRAKRQSLSSGCQPVFEAGLRKRHIPF